jgi:uncharacterized protein (TIGR02646 family)
LRRLYPEAVAVPRCLGRGARPAPNWGALDHAHKVEIRVSLHELQGRFCAYCDADLDGGREPPAPDDTHDRDHIEHLWPKGRFPGKEFDWSNLFLSCNAEDTCGTHKEREGLPYEPEDLVNPCLDDPDALLVFRRDGRVEPRAREGRDRTRAEETIRVFNLNAPALRLQRGLALQEYRRQELEHLLADPEFWRQVIAEELKASETAPFSAVVRQFLTWAG